MKNNIPRITVIVTCKNAAGTIQKTFDSLRSQKYENLELIVMDGMSKDGTQNIIENNKDIITTFISEEDKSGADAANKAISLSTGDIIGFLYADDYYADNMLSKISEAYISNENCEVLSYGMQIEKLHNQKIILQSYNKDNINLNLNNILFKHVLNHFYKRSLFDKYGKLKPLFFDNNVFFSNDREFLLRLALNNVKNYVIEEILYIATSHENSHTGSRKNIVRIREEHIGIADYFLESYSLSVYKKDKLILFKSHNLSLLFAWFVLTIRFSKAVTIFKQGYSLRGLYWMIDIIVRPLSEIKYRLSVKYWF